MNAEQRREPLREDRKIEENKLKVLKVTNTCEAPQESEHKWLTKAKSFLIFFNVDASQWNRWKIMKWILSKILLSIIVLAFAVYTAKTSLVLLLDYAQSPTSYTPKAMFNESIALLPSKICLPLSPYELDKYWVWRGQSVLPSDNNAATHYQKLLLEFFKDETTAKETLLSTDRAWPPSLLFIVHRYLNFIMQFEALFDKEAIEQMNALDNSYNDLATAIIILDDRMKYLNISPYDLKIKFGIEVRALFDLTIIHHKKSSSKFVDVEIDSSISSFEDGCICYNARLDKHPLIKEDSIFVQARRSGLPNPHPDYKLQYSMIIGIDRGSSSDHYHYYRRPFDSTIFVVPFQVTSTVRSMPYLDGKERCSENKSSDFCMTECRRDYIGQRCGCIPTLGYMLGQVGDSTDEGLVILRHPDLTGKRRFSLPAFVRMMHMRRN